jgi:plasmid replication initiation protein
VIDGVALQARIVTSKAAHGHSVYDANMSKEQPMHGCTNTNSEQSALPDRLPQKRLPHSLKKHVAVVHTSGSLSLVERKIANILLLNAYDNLVPLDGKEARHKIPVRYLCKMVGWDESSNDAAIKDALRSLQKTILEFNLMDDGREEWESMSMLSYVGLKNGICIYGYVSELARKLHNPDVFAIINVEIQKRFRGGYSLTLYENCARYRNVRSTGWWTIEKFRRIMGADAAMYDEFKRLSAFVINKAVEEVNAVSDIRITPEYRKDGRKVVALRFLVESENSISDGNIEALESDESNRLRESESYRRLKQHGISDRLAIMWLRQDPEQARLAIDAAEEKDRAGKIRSNTGAYIRRLIEDGAALGKSEYDREKERIKRVEQEKADERKLHEQARALSAAESTKRRKAMLDGIDPLRLRDFAEQFLEQLSQEDRQRAGEFDVAKKKFNDVVLSARFRNVWLPERIRDPGQNFHQKNLGL